MLAKNTNIKAIYSLLPVMNFRSIQATRNLKRERDSGVGLKLLCTKSHFSRISSLGAVRDRTVTGVGK
jgi:hypothetical protein